MKPKQVIIAGLTLLCISGCRLFRPNLSIVHDQQTYPDGTLHWYTYCKAVGKGGTDSFYTVYYPNGQIQEINFTVDSQEVYKLTLNEKGNIVSEYKAGFTPETKTPKE